MSEKSADDAEEQIGFPGGWKGLYIFLVIYGVIQVILLYLITLALN